MEQGTGLPGYASIAIGPAVLWRKTKAASPLSAGTPAEEQARFVPPGGQPGSS